MKRLSVVAICGLAMLAGGCSMLGGREYALVRAAAEEGIETAVQDRKEFNDLKADVLLALPCDASLGAVMRLGDSRKRALLIELCGGPKADSQMTVDDLANLMRLVQQP